MNIKNNCFRAIFCNARTFGSKKFLLLLLLLTNCTHRQQPKDNIIAIVGDRVITRDEFIRRAEYTIRPPYCKRNSNIEKQIILNSIIAEKLFAFEAGEENPLVHNATFQAYIKGRKEQVMRQCLFDNLVKDKIKPSKSEFNQRYKVAGREYRLAYFTMNQVTAQEISGQIKKSLNADSFDRYYSKTGAIGSPPERTVSWKSQEDPVIHRALFARPLKKDEIVGPIQVDSDEYLMMKIQGWTDHPAVDDASVRQRSEDVENELEREKGQELWDQYIIDIMKNKKLVLQKETFEKMATLMQPIYLTRGHKEEMVLNGSGIDARIPTATIDSLATEIKTNDFENRPFFAFDNKSWTVADFIKLYASHPLVFRKKHIGKDDFLEQFKQAVADLLRDYVVNQKAYEQKIDKYPVIIEHTNMWQDAILASYYRFNYLKSRGAEKDSGKDYMVAINKYLNAYADSLFQKYSDRIWINISEFEKIKLTRIDMMVLNQNVPYLEAVPAFPLLTTKTNLNYGKKLE